MKPLFRTRECEARYQEYKKQRHPTAECPLCAEKTITHFSFWKIIENQFPYNRIAETHHMVILSRHGVESSLTHEERAELVDIKNGYINLNYQFILEATQKGKSIPNHFHLHLIVAKDWEKVLSQRY